MIDQDIFYFEQLKKEVQSQYLKKHTPSNELISQWKGIDIIYFQEDLRKKTKSIISEKSFYTYFKNSRIKKLPRIDTLNLLAGYAGYDSWYEFKKTKSNINTNDQPHNPITIPDSKEKISFHPQESNKNIFSEKNNSQKPILQINSHDYQIDEKNERKSLKLKSKLWLVLTLVLISIIFILEFSNQIFGKNYIFCFIDSDRGTKIQNILEIKIIKEEESPIYYRLSPGECFYYNSKEKKLKMEISSPFYETIQISRNIENAPEKETIGLKPNDYALMLHYYSTKEISDKSLEQIKLKQQKLNLLISEKALIYQIFDNDLYGVETLSKQKYIGLVTTPTKSLKNLKVIDTKKENDKIVLIKFKIENDEKN